MEITAEQYERIQDCLPVQRGNVRHDNLVLLNAILYVAKHGCKWRGLPKRYGNWHSICAYEPLGQERRAGSGVRQVAAGADSAPQDRGLQFGLDLGESAPGWNWGFKKNGPQSIGKSRGGWNTKIHLVAANARTAIIFCLSPGEAHDAPVGRQLLLELGPMLVEVPLVMDRAYESDETRQLVLELNMIPVVPPKSNRREPWDYDRELYKKRNQVERLFRRLKGFRRIFSRFEKLDVVFLAFIYFACIIEALR